MPGPRGPGGRLDLNRPTYPLAAAIQLLEHGAHLVLVARWGETKRDGTQSKRPLWRKYLRRPASFMQVKDHITGGGLLGIVPASLGRAVLDVDQGDPTPLICDFLPWFAARSQQEGRMHLWYRDDARHRRGGVWRSDNGCGGELLASTGYVVLWGNALQDLAETLAYGDRPGQAPFAAVASALTWRDMSPPEPADTKAPAPTPTSKPVPAPAAQRRSVAAAPDLSQTWPGLRNISLFDDLRLWAYRAYRSFSQYEDFAEAARQRALAGRERMPVLDDFEDAEAATVARSVSVWTWTIKPTPGKRNGNDNNSGQQEYSPRSPATGEQQYRGDPALNADSEIQRYRRGCRTQLDAIRVEHRQACIANRYVLGTPVAKLAITFGVTRRTVERDLSTAQLPTRSVGPGARCRHRTMGGGGANGRQTSNQRYWNHHWTGNNSRAFVCYSAGTGKSGSTQLAVLDPSLDVRQQPGIRLLPGRAGTGKSGSTQLAVLDPSLDVRQQPGIRLLPGRAGTGKTRTTETYQPQTSPKKDAPRRPP